MWYKEFCLQRTNIKEFQCLLYQESTVLSLCPYSCLKVQPFVYDCAHIFQGNDKAHVLYRRVISGWGVS